MSPRDPAEAAAARDEVTPVLLGARAFLGSRAEHHSEAGPPNRCIGAPHISVS